MAKFSRSSTAYKSDGTLVNAGVPRIEADKGVLVEEGTVNLLPSDNQNKLVNGTPNANSYVKTTGLVQGGTYTFSGQKRIFPDDNATLTNCKITLYYSDSTFTNVTTTTDGISKDGVFYPFAVSATANSSKTLTQIRFMIFNYDTCTLMHQECQNVIAEQKPYATTFHPSTRTAESLTVPASALNASDGTIEFDYIPINYNKSTYKDLVVFAKDNYHFVLRGEMNGSYTLMATNGQLTKKVNATLTIGTKYKFKVAYGSEIKMTRDGVVI